ncbi:MAG: GNAT family N-acetyltransferase [Thermoleophilia bacterium]|nr:GNAT family N-acetyltransferase [Thermoleophilia bacterium]
MVQQEALIRPMRQGDFEGVVALDSLITGQDRSTYYRRKFRLLEDPDTVNTCLSAELDGAVVGFVMGDMFTGEYGVPEATAVIDTIGVHPHHQDRGIATALFEQFRSNLRALNVRTAYVLVEWGDWSLAKFFQKEGFRPSNRVNLELRL